MKYVIALLALTGPALADCPAPETMHKAATEWLAGARLADPDVGDMKDAACAYAAFRDGLEDDLGRPVGVKVGFTSKPSQEKFGVDAPVAGALFAPMLLENGAAVSLKGSRTPFYEADLIVTVKDPDALAKATTREEAAAALGEVQAFVELPDMALAEGLKPTGPIMASYGVIPWRGVLGDKVAMADLPDPVADLAALTVTLNSDAKEDGLPETAKGEALLGHPLDVVLWLVKQGGFNLSAGGVISLGSLGKLHPAKPGLSISADYMVGGKPLKVAFTTVE